MLRLFLKPQHIISGRRSSDFHLHKNELGYRGNKIEYDKDDYVVILLGDSQVEATMCSFDWMPEKRTRHF